MTPDTEKDQIVADKLAVEFVNTYPALFTEDKWFWAREISELILKGHGLCSK